MPEALASDYGRHNKKINKITDKYRGGTYLHSRQEAGNQPPLALPGVMTPYSPEEDTRVALKTHLVKTGEKPFGEIFQEKDDVDWMLRQLKIGRVLQDYKMFIDQWNLRDPAQLRLAQEICPQYFDALEEQVLLNAELQVKLARIGIRGQKSWDDWLLLSQILRGEVVMPQGPLWNPGGVDQANMATYDYGMFNPRTNPSPVSPALAGNIPGLNFMSYLTNNLLKNEGAPTLAMTSWPKAAFDFQKNNLDALQLARNGRTGGQPGMMTNPTARLSDARMKAVREQQGAHF